MVCVVCESVYVHVHSCMCSVCSVLYMYVVCGVYMGVCLCVGVWLFGVCVG